MLIRQGRQVSWVDNARQLSLGKWIGELHHVREQAG